MIPDDIPPAPYVNLVAGIAFLVMAAFAMMPLGFSVYYDGLISLFRPPAFLWGSLAVALLLILVAIRTLTSPTRAGAEVRFLEDGFQMNVRPFLRAPQHHRLAWSDIDDMKLVKVPRGGDAVSFGLKNGKTITLPINLTAYGADEAVKRFQMSAGAAGFALEQASGVDVLVFARKVWRVVQKS